MCRNALMVCVFHTAVEEFQVETGASEHLVCDSLKFADTCDGYWLWGG